MYAIVQFHAKPNCEKQLMQALISIAEPTRAEPGCIEIHYYRALRDPATFFVQSAWINEEAFERHATLPHMTAFLSQVPQWIDHEVRAVRCALMA